MRLISQDGMIDVPYEYGSLLVGVGHFEDVEFSVIKYSNVSSPNGTKLAEYSSKSKALKVMEMLRERYIEHFDVNLDSCWYSNDYPKVFKFPTDEEVEV